jgi:hypothetical protein
VLEQLVCLTGSPGCGKTFAVVPAVVAEVLLRGLPVLHVSKDREMHFFMPPQEEEGGKVDAWTLGETEGRSWFSSKLAHDPRASPASKNPPSSDKYGCVPNALIISRVSRPQGLDV